MFEKRLQELGLEDGGNKAEKCARLASFLYKNKINVWYKMDLREHKDDKN